MEPKILKLQEEDHEQEMLQEINKKIEHSKKLSRDC